MGVGNGAAANVFQIGVAVLPRKPGCLVCRTEATAPVNVGGPRWLCSPHVTDWVKSAELRRATTQVGLNPNHLYAHAVAFQDWRIRLQKEAESNGQ